MMAKPALLKSMAAILFHYRNGVSVNVAL